MVTATHDLSIVEAIADQVFVFDEEHHLAASGRPDAILSNHELLLRCNLVHEHRHRHDAAGPEHTHAHLHLPLHGHHEDDER